SRVEGIVDLADVPCDATTWAMQGSTADSMQPCRTIKYQAFHVKRQFVRVRVRVRVVIAFSLIETTGIMFEPNGLFWGRS
ncbi:MAG: hypothetical protein RLZZ396_2439, partial [Planctomycetota bacterium]